MHEAIARMLSKYDCEGLNDYINALREILCAAGSFRRQNARHSLPEMEKSSERARLVRSGLVCRVSP